jgi:hypothetical protein
VGFRRRWDPSRRHFLATAAEAGAPGRTAAPSTSPASRAREKRRRLAGPRVWSTLWRPRRVRVGREPALIAHGGRPARALARHARACRLRGCPSRPPRRLSARGPAPRRHALSDRAPGGPLLAGGASPSRWPSGLGPAAAELSRGPGPRASDASARVAPGRPGQLRRSPWRCGSRPGPRLLPFLSTTNFRASAERLKRKGGGRKAAGKTPLPLRARLRLGAPPPAGAAGGRSSPRPRLAPGSPPPPPRPQPPPSL